MIYTKKFGPAAYAARVRASLMRDVGPCMNPFAAFLVLQGIETLSLRAERHSQNGIALARYVVTDHQSEYLT